MLGAQRMMLEEMAFAADAMLDRVRTETHLWGGICLKLASSHSVQDLNATAGNAASISSNSLRRDCDRLIPAW